ncbi:uncharacterized protein UV8b_01585 [Ustilaginoidea virens]|uniref:Uncharacterized protein n=1 Tax=Ustilaginoidea virens TaxID=1159556 RepID=A0A8E5HKV5_USTVR|nr:uncharacterized protein UV8b_01585 [Ustilaginoidea virens]QUC17344.1 hypothetical protein UV8b_01585 [Ustilaginoidea virens]
MIGRQRGGRGVADDSDSGGCAGILFHRRRAAENVGTKDWTPVGSCRAEQTSGALEIVPLELVVVFSARRRRPRSPSPPCCAVPSLARAGAGAGAGDPGPWTRHGKTVGSSVVRTE